MKYKFKVGDRVRCIKSNTYELSPGHVIDNGIYVVTDISTAAIKIRVNDSDSVDQGYWYSKRFIPYINPVTLPEELFEL